MTTPIGVFTTVDCDEHSVPSGHPERRGRVEAALGGLRQAGLDEALEFVEPRPATRAELERVHSSSHIEHLAAFCESGGGPLDADTYVAPGSFETARRAAGAVLEAVESLRSGACDVALAASRPPGHHAVASGAMGFCLFNNVAVAAAEIAEAGERVAIVDWDVHHGNGTQDIFYDDPRVLYVSTHQSPLYPGTGHLSETGGSGAEHTNLNLPFPRGTRGDTFREAFDEVIVPVVERFGPDWLFISAGFDAHRSDPLAELELTAADYSDLARRLQSLVRPRRLVVALEGGYDFDALAASTGATMAALVGEGYRPEEASIGDIGRPTVTAAKQRWLDE